MKENIKVLIGQMVVPVICFLAIGILLFGLYIFQPKYTSFSYIVYGLSAVLFYNYCKVSNRKNYVLVSILYSFIMILIFQKTSNVIRFGRNFCWFVLIGILAFIITEIEKEDWFLKSKAWIISSWLFGFIMVYIVMSIINIFVLGFYPLDERFTFLLYLKQSVKIGGTLGIGIGLGHLINTYLFKEYPSHKTMKSNLE